MSAGGRADDAGAARRARVVALLGAESTGKTDLARALAAAIEARCGLRAAWVPEHLRAWCDAHGRTPRRDEQAAIARAQADAIDAAAGTADVVVADTTPLMTALYSEWVFGDESLTAAAVAWQRGVDATLVAAPDLGWTPDGIQRDGPDAQRAIDRRLRALLDAHGLPWREVRGVGAARLDSALHALAATLPASPGERSR